MLCAILSDTVIFKSPTCTTADIKCVEALAEIAGIEDFKELGMDMFRVKSAVEDTPVRDLVMRDFKDFNMNGNLVLCANRCCGGIGCRSSGADCGDFG